VRIGQDGFGFAIDPKGHVRVPQLGRVIVEDDVEIAPIPRSTGGRPGHGHRPGVHD